MLLRLVCAVLVLYAWLGQALLRPGWRLAHRTSHTIPHFRAALAIAQSPLDPAHGPFYLDQPFDHNNPESGTFRQRYWANTEWYQPGGPVILYNAGELAADWRASYVTNSSMALLAQKLGGIVVVLEHRSYGESQPGKDYSVEYLRTLNTEQALADMAFFIQNASLPNLSTPLPPPPETSWIVYGGSYSGNLAAWMRLHYPDLVFAAVPSSAPVQMSYNFYEYFETVQRYAPAKCVSAIERVIRVVDRVLANPFSKHRQELKATFGLADLKHDDDFAELLSYPLGLWQEMTPTENPFVDEFCPIFEGADSVEAQVKAYGRYIADKVKEVCEDTPSVNDCLDSHDPRGPYYANVSSPIRPWMWQICTEYAYFQTAPPLWRPTIVSRFLTTTWYQRQCQFMFGEHAVPFRPAWRQINHDYQGWHIDLTRVFWIDGEWDPWRSLSVQSDQLRKRPSTDDAHYVVLSESVHHWDFFVSDFVSDQIKETQKQLTNVLSGWLQVAKQKPETAPALHIQRSDMS